MANNTFNLRGLPTEVLCGVFEALAAGAQPTEKPYDEVDKDRATLHNLSLVNRRFYSGALPLLYRDIQVTWGHQIFPLFRSLWNDPDLRHRIKSFGCYVT